MRDPETHFMGDLLEMWMPGWPHEAPEDPFAIFAAHYVMQQHRSCDRFDCARKSAAWDVLVEAGKIVPDSGRIPTK